MKSLGVLFVLTIGLSACSSKYIFERQEWAPVFDKQNAKGSFALFDNGLGRFDVYNLPAYKDSSYNPTNTFDIFLTLVGLSNGTLYGLSGFNPTADSLKNTHIDSPLSKLPLHVAFNGSSTDFFRVVFDSLGKKNIAKMMDSLSYGNKRPVYWTTDSLRITPDEQLGLVKKLYFGQLPVQSRAQNIVKQLLIQENTINYTFAYKTATYKNKVGNSEAWVVGWIEENRHPYFFSLHISLSALEQDAKNIAVTMLKDLLKQEGFFEGKK